MADRFSIGTKEAWVNQWAAQFVPVTAHNGNKIHVNQTSKTTTTTTTT
jgi:hypothetical protein